jgi:porphobilinogen synthase
MKAQPAPGNRAADRRLQREREYALVKAVAERCLVDERAVSLANLLCLNWAGSDLILTYQACVAAFWLRVG